MRDISSKTSTLRTATAEAVLTLSPETVERIRQNDIPKGNPLEVARVAAIQAAKNTSQIIPFCHPLPLEQAEIGFILSANAITVTASVKAVYKTGVEMEALTAASVAALTLYDMLKMLDDSMKISGVRLVKKTGGKSDYWDQFESPLRAGVLVLSDSVSAGVKEDVSGKLIAQRLQREGFDIVACEIIADDRNAIADTLKKYADTMHLDLVVTTGGTGYGPRDNTSDAMQDVIEREMSGISEAMRAYGQTRTPFSMLSRGKAGMRGHTIIINLPGSASGVEDSLNALFPGLMHAFIMLRGGGHPSHDKRTKA